MAAIRVDDIAKRLDGPALVAAASGLMLLPENASRLLRLHRLAALGMALAGSRAQPVSPTTVRSVLKRDDIGGPAILMQEDPYSAVLIHSVSFFGGPFLVSPGSGDHAVADLENLLDALFREPQMPDDLRSAARQLVRGLLTVSDIVLRRAGLTRGTAPGRRPQSAVAVPGAARLRELSEAAFISDDELCARGDWLRRVIDTLALDPGQLVGPCTDDIADDRLYVRPFLRLAGGYRVILPLDLSVTIRFHLLQFAFQTGQLEELGRRWREAAWRRVQRLAASGPPVLLEHSDPMSRYLLKIDSKRDVHVVVATDPLTGWQPEVWGTCATHAALDQLASLMSPGARRTYSTAEELLHLVITDSPGRAAFWGVPDVDGADPVLITRADDLEVMLHHEPDGLLGLLLFAQAIQMRPGESMSMDILDEFCAYVDHSKSFYLTDGRPPTATSVQAGDGLYPRQKYHAETDRHGVVSPLADARILQARRRYPREAPEIFVIEPGSSYTGYVVELEDEAVFITLRGDAGPEGAELRLLECVAYWVRECAIRTGTRVPATTTEIVLTLGDPDSWTKTSGWSTAGPAVLVDRTGSDLVLTFTERFAGLLQDPANTAERDLVKALLFDLFAIPDASLASAVEAVIPPGSKRMLHAISQNNSPEMLGENLSQARTGHDQVTAQVLDELGQWLRSPAGAGLPTGALAGKNRAKALNAAVSHLFDRLEHDIASYDQRSLLDFLIANNESLMRDAGLMETMLTSRLACFGEQSHTVTDLVQQRKTSGTAQQASRFLIEYVAAQPPPGTRTMEVLDYYRVLATATEIIQRPAW